MKKLALITVAALTALSVPAAIVAQDVSPDVSAGINLQAGVDITADQATTLLNDFSATTAADITAFADASAINIVNVGAWLGDDADASASAALQAAIDASSANFMSLESSLSANATIVAALEAEGYTTQDVVGVSNGIDGELTIFVQSA